MHKRIQDVDAFRKRSAFSRLLGRSMVGVFNWFCKDKNFKEQAPEASRNIELIIENAIRMATDNPREFATFLSVVMNWQNKYFGTHEKQKKLDGHYLLYTNIDHAIPFKPEEDTLYSCILSQAAIVASYSAPALKGRKFEHTVSSFKELNKQAAMAFMRYPTRVPRFESHNRLQLGAVQKFDPPYNNCPSFHITYSAYLCNIAGMIGLADKDAKAWEFVEHIAQQMPRTVLSVKQHALEDIAAGIALPEGIYNHYFPNAPKFDNITTHFPTLLKQNPEIPYCAIQERYERLSHRIQKNANFVTAIGDQIKEGKYPILPIDHPDSYYDLESGNIVPIAGGRISGRQKAVKR